MPKVLLVEDDADFLNRVQEWLSLEKFTVETTSDGSDALERLKTYEYDIIVLDWNLPGMSGVDILNCYRSFGGKTPVLMLTGRNTVSEKTTGLDAGADDYLTKPFDLLELSARLRALLRRPHIVQASVLSAGDIELDTVSRTLRVAGQSVTLLPLEYSLLEFFMRHPNQVFSHTALVDRVWKAESTATAEAVRTCVMALRKKIASPGRTSMIKTVHGTGYRFEAD